MVRNLKKILILIVFVLLAYSNWANNSPDSLKNTFNSLKLYQLNNIWLNTKNITGIIYNYNNNLGRVLTGYQHIEGDYKRQREAQQVNDYLFFTESYQKIKKLNFFGKFSYHSKNERGILWSGVFSPYRGSPYIIGDSVKGSHFYKQVYNLSGGIAQNVNDKIGWGIFVNYLVGVTAKQKDPRPKTTVMRFLINPSVIVPFKSSKLGIDMGYQNRKEEISYLQVASDNPDPTFFSFKGFGFYKYSTGDGNSRFQTEKSLLGGIQYEKTFGKSKTLTEIRTKYSKEITEDGSSTIKKEDGGDWKVINLNFKQQLFKRKHNAKYRVLLEGAYYNGRGIEYNQKIIYDDNQRPKYLTISKNLKFKRQKIDVNLFFDYIKLFQKNQINWTLTSSVNLRINNEKYYYVPETFKANYSNLKIGASFEKDFYFKHTHLALVIKTAYQHNLSHSIIFSEDKSITKNQNTDLFISDFNFYNENFLNGLLYANVGFNNLKIRGIDQIFLQVGYENWVTFKQNQFKRVLTGKIGLMF